MELKIDETEYKINVVGTPEDIAAITKSLYKDYIFGGYTPEVNDKMQNRGSNTVALPTTTKDEMVLYGNEGLEYTLLDSEKKDLFFTRVKSFHHLFETLYY